MRALVTAMTPLKSNPEDEAQRFAIVVLLRLEIIQKLEMEMRHSVERDAIFSRDNIWSDS